MGHFKGQVADCFGPRANANQDEGLVEIVSIDMCHWDCDRSADSDAYVSALAEPLVEVLSHTHGKEAEEAVDIEVIGSHIRFTTGIIKHLLSVVWTFSVLDLPQAHQVVSLRADETD